MRIPSTPLGKSAASTTQISGLSSEAVNRTILPLVNGMNGDFQKSIANTRNLSIAPTSDRLPKITRKVPLKTFSLVDRSPTKGAILPDYAKPEDRKYDTNDESYQFKSPASVLPRKSKRNQFRASEAGLGNLLPSFQQSSSTRTTSSLNNMSSYSYYETKPGISRSRTMTDSISNTWSSVTGTKKSGGRSSDELPLHTQLNEYDEALKNNNQSEKQKVSLRSRRARTSTEDYDQNGGDGGGGYASMDGSSHDFISRSTSVGGVSGGGSGGWLPWSSSNNTHSDISPTRYKLSKRRNSGSSQGCLLPLTVTPYFCSYGRNRSVHSVVKPILQSQWIQTFIVIVATLLVFHSYQRTQIIQASLEIFHDKESMSLLHLKTVEQQLVHLHENVVRINDFATIPGGVVGRFNGSNGSPEGDVSKKEAVDANLIRVQTQQLYQMEEELDHELRSLQSKIQHVARSSIVSSYGEGPVQVVLELDFHDAEQAMPLNFNPEHNKISILLWYDTPHAAWMWLHQIRKGRWNNANFQIGKGSLSIDAVQNGIRDEKSGGDDNIVESLKFVEKSKKTHEPWTVGLTETDSGMGMFINLQDNSALRKKDVCVGKVIDGFDALQLLVDASRRMDGTGRSVSIKNAFATHLTRGQTPGIM
jgi:hypothetical protein